MKLTEIDHHSVALDLLTGGAVLDVGARGYHFARYFAGRGHRVVAMEPDSTADQPRIEGVEIVPVALVGKVEPHIRRLALHPNPEARYVVPDGEECKYPIQDVECLTVTDLMYRRAIKKWDLVKLNCEGEESEILAKWPGPIANQIVVSFHEHFRPIGEDAIEKVMQHMDQWYVRVRHVFDERYGGGRNAWDTVLVLKELI